MRVFKPASFQMAAISSRPSPSKSPATHLIGISPTSVVLGPVDARLKLCSGRAEDREGGGAGIVPDGGNVRDAVAIEITGDPLRRIDPRALSNSPVFGYETGTRRAAHGKRILAGIVPDGDDIGAAVTVKVAGEPPD